MSVDPQPPQPRPYRSAIRERRAQATRQSILEAGVHLFVRDGYAGTTMRSIATEAGVSERTVFLAFPHKAALLSQAVRSAVRGDDGDHVPMLEQAGWRRVLESPAEQLVERLAVATTTLWKRTARLMAVAEAAAQSDPALAELRDRGHEATRADMQTIAQAMEQKDLLRDTVDVAYATDTLFALVGCESLYLRLTEECGRTPEEYAGLLEQVITRTLTRIADS